LVKHPTQFTQKEFQREQSIRRYHFAKFCAARRFETAPSGLTWAEVFRNKEGLTLEQFKEKVDAFKHGRKQG